MPLSDEARVAPAAAVGRERRAAAKFAVLEPGCSPTGSKPWVPLPPGGDPLEIPIDSNGNVLCKVDGADTWTYEWNAENDLTRVLKNNIEQARFACDPSGRRVEKVAAGVTTNYTYAGFNVLRETRSGATLKYVQGPDVDEPLAVDDGTGLSYFHADALGSVVRVTNGAGAVTLTRQYDAWGNLLSGAEASGYAFTGREWDPEVGLYHYRTRYYDPKLGRFISEDKIRFDNGDNFYAYVTDSPTNSVDPFGFCGLGGCSSKISPAPPEPTPPSCIAPADYACPCPYQVTYDRDVYRDCMLTGGAAGGGPSGGNQTANYGKKQRKPVVNPPAVSRPQGQNACIVGGMVMIMQLPQICHNLARKCVLIGSDK